MTYKSSREVFDLFEQRGVMGVVQETLRNATTIRTKENYERITKNMLGLFSSGLITGNLLQQHLEQILYEEEIVLVIFKKYKKNEKTRGTTKMFKQGFSYYIEPDDYNKIKVYLHWKEEKENLLKNIKGLKRESFWVEVRNIEIANVLWFNLHLFNAVENTIFEAEISLYIGY